MSEAVSDFQMWWDIEGAELALVKSAKELAAIAWANGSYCAANDIVEVSREPASSVYWMDSADKYHLTTKSGKRVYPHVTRRDRGRKR